MSSLNDGNIWKRGGLFNDVSPRPTQRVDFEQVLKEPIRISEIENPELRLAILHERLERYLRKNKRK